VLEILEEGGNSAAAHQMRWARWLEQGSKYACFPGSPKDQEPESFSEHWTHCSCNFWHWFLAHGVDREIKAVLDVGCGVGHLAEHFKRHGHHATGVTSNRDEKMQCLRRGIEVLEDDFHFLSVPAESFDMVLSSQSFEHSISPLFALLEWKRIVRPGGYLMIILPMPIEGDLRAGIPDHYDPATDTLDFAITAGETFSLDCLLSADYTYGIAPHIFLLTYWQLTALFRWAGWDLVGSAVEDVVPGKPARLGEADGRLPRDPRRALNGLFLLRKPSGGAQPSSAA
jgi:SAM-dependent methyltransferase